MRKIQAALLFVALLGGAFVAFGAEMHGGVAVAGSSADYYRDLMQVIAGDWQKYGKMFTFLQSQWCWKVFLGLITIVPALFLGHYLIIGARHFDHEGEQIFFFPLFIRIVHFFAAISFSLLVITGLMIILGAWLGGGPLVRTARYVHLTAAMVFVLPALFMFIVWFKDMLPRLYDIKWIFILGGYLSKKKTPIPAGKFNAGQKLYFWTATCGCGIMAYTGYTIWGMNADTETVRLYTLIHNMLAIDILVFYLTHVYMSVFAIAGSLQSMKTGYKPKEEVDILHSRYQYPGKI
jgi:formate dehydrogenase subunit gamma